MNTYRKTLLLPALLAGFLITTAASGQITFSDNFNRPDGPPGPDWSTVGGTWDIFSEHLRATSDNTNMRAARFEVFNLADTPAFTIGADVRATSGGRWGGLAFHMQEDGNTYYTVRVSHQDTAANGQIQFLRITNGSASGGVLFNPGVGSIEAGVNTYYRHEITSETPGVFLFNYYSLDANRDIDQLLYTKSFSDSVLTGGFAGVHSGAHQVLVDDYSLTVIPEPATTGILLAGLALAGVFWYRRKK